MNTKNIDNRFTLALEAIGNLLLPELDEILRDGWSAALAANSEIKIRPISQRTGSFYRHLVPLLKDLASLLASTYRRYFKLALAHPQQSGPDPHEWALHQLGAPVGVTLEWIRNWYILACDGSNQYMQLVTSVPFEPGQTVSMSISLKPPEIASPESWRAPAWLFEVDPIVGIGPLKTEHVPATDTEEKLGAAHTRLLLKGARRVFLWKLGAEIKTVCNEEIAAAGAIPAEPANRHTQHYNKRKGWQQRIKLYEAIRKILVDNPSLQGIKFCAELDKRHAPPLFDWTKTGEWRKGFTWKEAWGQPSLKRKIRRVRQEAMRNR
ncbi:MAG: hypothetical protein DMG58_17560 [Acidobacteria bacterium]|nr:MAG: hypothetical protein DMG58_17560 [Acidobacteriota bacterium]